MSPSRSEFLEASLASSTLVSMGAATIPDFLGRSALARAPAKSNDRILVVVQLLGGNDGLNTVVPHGIDGYNRGRRVLRWRRPGPRITPRWACIRRWARWRSCSRTAGWRSCRESAIRTRTARTSGRWRSGRPPAGPSGPRDRLAGPGLDAGPRPGGDSPALHIGGRALPQALRGRAEVASLESLEQLQAPAAWPEPRASDAPALDKAGGSKGRRTIRCWASSGGARCRVRFEPPGSSRSRGSGRTEVSRTTAWRDGWSWSPRSSRRASARGSSTRRSTASTRTPISSGPTLRCCRAVRLGRRVPRRPLRRRPGRPGGAADVQRIRPTGRENA